MPVEIDVKITYLEQRSRPLLPTPIQPAYKTALLRAENPPIHYYRYLYDLVGRPYNWISRTTMSDEELGEILHNTAVHIYVLYAEGVPAGFAEIDARLAKDLEIKFFGLAPDFVGKGLGRFFLTHIIDMAWALGPSRVVLETCTLDHPAALALYQKHGFSVFDQRDGRVTLLAPDK